MTIKERPPAERITEILDNRQNIARLIRGYQTRRDFLQLCAEIDHCRNSVILPSEIQPSEGGM